MSSGDDENDAKLEFDIWEDLYDTELGQYMDEQSKPKQTKVYLSKAVIREITNVVQSTVQQVCRKEFQTMLKKLNSNNKENKRKISDYI